MVIRTSNKKCRPLVEARKVFKASHLYSSLSRNVYVVYSYGPHWPLLVCINDVWYENSDKYSLSTSRHLSQARPYVDTVKADCRKLKELVSTYHCSI